jgi:hypothetical protein
MLSVSKGDFPAEIVEWIAEMVFRLLGKSIYRDAPVGSFTEWGFGGWLWFAICLMVLIALVLLLGAQRRKRQTSSE